MPNRIYLDTNDGLKISKPGVNVLTASPDQMLFSSQNAQLTIVETGVINRPANFGMNAPQYTHNFTSSFSSPPIVFLYSSQNVGDKYFLGISAAGLGATATYGSAYRVTHFFCYTLSYGIKHQLISYSPTILQDAPLIFDPYPLYYYVADMEF